MSPDASGRGDLLRARGGAKGRAPLSRTAELARKRERRSHRLRLVGFVAILLALSLAAAYMFWLRDSSLVEIENLQVVGVDRQTEEGKQIDQAIRTAVGEMTTLHVKPEVLDQELARYPRVSSAAIETSLPDSATVTVELREDGSIFGEGSDALLIATDGTVLGPAAGQEESLPLIGDGDPPPAASNGQSQEPRALSGRALAQALVLGAAPEVFRPYVKGSNATANGVEVEFDNGLVILFGDPAHSDQKWRAAATLIADPEFDTSSYVDLTVPRRPAVSGGESSTELVPEETEAVTELGLSG